MHQAMLKSMASERLLTEWKGDDLKSDDQRAITNREWVHIHRDFTKVTDSDLHEVFSKLKTRCPETWTIQLEKLSIELHRKFMTLRNGNAAMFIDPTPTPKVKTAWSEVRRLMTIPESWGIYKKKRAYEFSEILHHFTIFAPSVGRPFVRAWLEALLPCFSRWILLSDSEEVRVVQTLKHFLGAFGQPGIVVCLADQGASMLKILKNSARSVEAIGRGTVERHYWKCLTQSSCGGDPGWRELANIKNKPIVCSQLDYVPQGWLLDANDWCQIFANLVSPEISNQFEKKIMKKFKDNKSWEVKAGPPKTFDRCKAKSEEYKSEFAKQNDMPRWKLFANKFKSVFHRAPSKPEDFVWNILDFARCSITVPDADDVLKVKTIIEENFRVICVKNSYNSEERVKGSGYRDLKLLIEVEFDDLKFGGVIRAQPKTTLICEVQVLCRAWLENKKTSSISYKILRAQSLRALLYDAAKYLKGKTLDSKKKHLDTIEIIKQGWSNLANAADFSNIDAESLLFTACNEGWDVGAVSTLITDLKADINVTDESRNTPLITACSYDAHDITKCLIKLRCNIEQRDDSGKTALLQSVLTGSERCVQSLVYAKANVAVENNCGHSAQSLVMGRTGDPKFERIKKLLKGETVIVPTESGEGHTKLEELKIAASGGSLAQFFDVNEVQHSLVSEFLASAAAVGSLENLLQTLYFGGSILHTRSNWTAIHYASEHGTPATVSVLLTARAAVNGEDYYGNSPLAIATRFGKPEVMRTLIEADAALNIPLITAARFGKLEAILMLLQANADLNFKTPKGISPLFTAVDNAANESVKLLLESRADVNAKTDGISPLMLAVVCGNAIMVTELLKFDANVHDKLHGRGICEWAERNDVDRDNVLSVLKEHLSV